MTSLINKRVICTDGFKMSVQANEAADCSPRVNNAEKYESVEVGYPSEREELLMAYAEDPTRPTRTVYGWVPSHVVSLVCVKHGGIVDGELPNGVPYLKPEKSRFNQ